MKLKLKSKALTLQELRPVIKSATVLPVYRFYAKEYCKYKDRIHLEVLKQFPNNELIVRSSSVNEDNDHTSHAGGFDSVLNVKNQSSDLDKAINVVIDSYLNIRDLDEVFIQPMLEFVDKCGVIFTADIDTLCPYYIINYDNTGSTTSVTSGTSNNLETRIIFKNSPHEEEAFITSLVNAAKECEDLYNNNALDIEFAFSGDILFILQVRKIVTKNKRDLSHINLEDNLVKIEKKLIKLNKKHPNLLGYKTIFGLMPDWNPAEIIGVRPRQLALSLYKEVVTDSIWAYQRDNYGYRNLRSHPLLVSFLGVPYVDVRVSFNSFIPKDLKPSIASKLVDYYLAKLKNNTNFHDKVEFDIVYSCYHLNLDIELEELHQNGFSAQEVGKLKKSLLELTNKIINVDSGLYKLDLEKIQLLGVKRQEIIDSDLAIIDKIYWLLEDIKRYGTLPFAGVARAAFIAVQMLKSFVKTGIITDLDYDLFLKSLNTVSKKLSKDINTLSKRQFLSQYGHLRPGTYDITSPRYDNAYESYFSYEPNISDGEGNHDVEFVFSERQRDKIGHFLAEHNIIANVEDLIIFIKEAIEGRESSKFEFTKSLSLAIEYISDLGGEYGFTNDDLSFLNVQVIRELYSTLDHRDLTTIISDNIAINKLYYEYTKSVKLPSLIVEPKDIYSFSVEQEQANFITQKKIKAEVVIETISSGKNLHGKIVCIDSADPGFDYLFSQDISGLVTCYGGANSHMAIRCAELGIPAVIGCGETLFKRCSECKFIEIDAGNKIVRTI